MTYLFSMRKAVLPVLCLSGVVLFTSCTPQETDLVSRIFPVPTEKTITDVPHIPVDQLLSEESPLRRFRNPQELQAALGGALAEKMTPVQTESLPSSVFTKSYVYRISETGISYVKLGDSQLPVRVMTLPFKPTGITLIDEMLVVTGEKDGRTTAAFIEILAPAAPRLAYTLQVEGTLQGVRFAPHTVFFTLRGQFKAPLALPVLSVNDQEMEYDYARSGCNCPSLYGFSRKYTNPGYVHVVSVNVQSTSLNAEQQIIALSEDQQAILGEKALYIAYKPQLTEGAVRLEALKKSLVPSLDATSKVQYTQIVQAPDYVLSPTERQDKQLRFLEQHLAGLTSSAKDNVTSALQLELEKELKSFQEKIGITFVHKLRFDENKLQYVTAARPVGTPFASPLLGETDKGTWILSKLPTGTGTILQTVDGQMQPQGSLTLEGLAQPQVRRAKNNELWLGDLGAPEASIISLADFAQPVQNGTRTLVPDARLVTIDDRRALQVNKNNSGIVLTLLETQGEAKQLATFEIKGNAAYTRFFENLNAALYIPSQKMLVMHVEEARGTNNNQRFDGVMVFAVGDNTLEKKAEFDLRSGMQELTSGSDISIVSASDTDVAVLYGKTASLINLPEAREVMRKVLQ